MRPKNSTPSSKNSDSEFIDFSFTDGPHPKSPKLSMVEYAKFVRECVQWELDRGRNPALEMPSEAYMGKPFELHPYHLSR